MKINTTIILLAFVFGISGCSMFGGKNENANSSNANSTNKSETTEKAETKASETREFTGDVKFPFDFPTVGTTGKKGDKAFVPSYNWLVDAMQKDPKSVTMIWYLQEISEPGDEMSDIKFMSDVKKVPNAYVIPIPAGQTAKKGDILLASWSYSMNRAIVTDASDPKAPTVRFLDLAYDNPATGKDGKTSIGQTEEQLKPDTFFVIKSELEPGTSVVMGSEMKHGKVIRVEGDKVFVSLFAGKIDVFPKSDVKAVPLKPNVKTGDKVKAVSFGKFVNATVVKVDANIGRVWVKYDSPSKEEVIAFGDIMPQ